jgi:DNA-binding transcriptional LysR family regulator
VFPAPADRLQLSLRVHPTIGIADVQQLLRQWRRELGPMDLHLLDDPLQPGDVDLAPQTCVPAGHHFVPLWEETFVLVVPPEHPLATQPSVSLADLHGTAMVERCQCELAARWQVGAQTLNIVPNVRARVRSEEWAIGLVASGVGVSLMAAQSVAHRTDVAVRHDVPELQGFRRTVGLAYAGCHRMR